jgi:MutS family domain IV
VPEAKKKAVPSDFELVGQKKGFQRFSNPELKRLVATLEEAQRQREIRLTAALQVRPSVKPEGSPTALLGRTAAASLCRCNNTWGIILVLGPCLGHTTVPLSEALR